MMFEAADITSVKCSQNACTLVQLRFGLEVTRMSVIDVCDPDPVVSQVMNCTPAFAQLPRCPKSQSRYHATPPQRCAEPHVSVATTSYTII
jgi:hypothetical protein